MNGCTFASKENSECVETRSTNTIYTDQPYQWRHAAFDSTHSILYFCDFSHEKQKILCYSSINGYSWTSKCIIYQFPIDLSPISRLFSGGGLST